MQKGITREDGGWRMGIILRLTADSTGTLAESMVQSLAPLYEVFIHQLGTTTPFTALPRSNLQIFSLILEPVNWSGFNF